MSAWNRGRLGRVKRLSRGTTLTKLWRNATGSPGEDA